MAKRPTPHVVPTPTTPKERRQPTGLRASLRQVPFLLYLVLAVLVFFGLTAVFFVRYQRGGGDTVEAARIRTERVHIRQFPIQEALADQYYPFTDESVVRVSPEYVTYYDMSGNTLVSFQIDTARPTVVQGDGVLLVYDQDGTTYYQFRGRGLYLYGETPDPIRHAAVARTGDFALLMQDSRARGTLRVMDDEGTHRFDRRFFDIHESGFPVNMDFTSEAEAIDVVMVNTDGRAAETRLMRLSIEDPDVLWTQRIEGYGALTLMARDSDGVRYLTDGQTVVQVRAGGVSLWKTFPTVREIVCDRTGLWSIDAEADTVEFQPWSAAGVVAADEATRVIPLDTEPAFWMAREMQLLVTGPGGRTRYAQLNRPDLPIEAPTFSGRPVRGRILVGGEAVWITSDAVVLFDGSISR